jgi:hypothetical protein
MHIGLNGTKLTEKKRRCPVHPIKKTPCVRCKSDLNEEFDYSADAAAILMYYKLVDDRHDEDFKKRLAVLPLMFFYKRAFDKAAKRRPYLAERIGRAARAQFESEAKESCSLDEAAEPTSAMMEAIFRDLCRDDPDMRDNAGRFGYFLGRYVYICDALDDLNDDYRHGKFNPLLARENLSKNGGADLPKSTLESAARLAKESINLTLGELSDSYVKMNIGEIKPITDNIVYLGLKDTFNGIVKKTAARQRSKERNRKHDRSL